MCLLNQTGRYKSRTLPDAGDGNRTREIDGIPFNSGLLMNLAIKTDTLGV
jgi:hypothetical protein